MKSKYEAYKILGYTKKYLQDDITSQTKREDYIKWFNRLNIALIKIYSKSEKSSTKERNEKTFYTKKERTKFAKKILKYNQNMPNSPISRLEKNITLMAKIFALTQLEKEVIGIVYRFSCYPILENFSEDIRKKRTWKRSDQIAYYLNVSEEQVANAIRPDSALLQNNILSRRSFLKEYFELEDWVTCLLQSPLESEKDLIKLLVGKRLESTLTLKDFDYIENKEDIIKLLKNSLKTREKGINILLYGPPGTGKTEFAKLIAQEAGGFLYEVTQTNGSEELYSVTLERTNQLQIANKALLGEKKGILLFDEAEDIFYKSPFESHSSVSKLKLNHILENNEKPTIWITNNIRTMERAHLRRFSYVLSMDIPSVKIRQRVWKTKFQEYGLECDNKQLYNFATNYKLSPSFVDNAVKAARLMKGGINEVKIQLKEMEKAYSNGKIIPIKKENAIQFDPHLLNTDINLEVLSNNLVSNGKLDFSLCLFGVPGTGKRAYGRYIANKLGLEVIQKRASDIISPYVGETEMQIAKAFAEAERNKAVLIFDEADTFLQDRRKASKSWEISQVNEMLTWMEQHPYPFICTTNLINQLDQASLRRFTFKVKYDYLKPEQIKLAFHDFFDLSIDDTSNLQKLTPGDFAVVRKKAEILGNIKNTEEIIKMLKQEQDIKEEKSIKIGFV